MKTHASTLLSLLLAAAACGGPEGLDLDLDVDTTTQELGSGAYGFVWTTNGAGTIGNSFSSAGGSVTVSHPSTGSYRVTFNGLSSTGGNVQVVAEGPDNSRCKTAGWSGFPVGIEVRCFTPFGAPVDTSFVALFASSLPGTSNRWGYAWANDPTAVLYTPSTSYQAHNSDRPITIWRQGTGHYRVYMFRLAEANGNAQVTAYGSGSEHCNVDLLGQGYVDVKCWTTTNQPVDTRFSVVYTSDGSLLVPGTQRGAYFHGHWPTAIYPYVPERDVAYPASSAWLSVTSRSTGFDQIKFNSGAPFDLSLGHTASLVTSYSSGASYCKPARGTGGFPLDIRCWLRIGDFVYPWNAEYLTHSASRDPL